VVWAHRQTDGKGQGDTIWRASRHEPDLFAVAEPGFLSPQRQFMLNKTLSLGVLDFARQLRITGSFKLKWPNDIYAGDQKLVGY